MGGLPKSKSRSEIIKYSIMTAQEDVTKKFSANQTSGQSSKKDLNMMLWAI
jgi:hypothetical protein